VGLAKGETGEEVRDGHAHPDAAAELPLPHGLDLGLVDHELLPQRLAKRNVCVARMSPRGELSHTYT
jgi:hypothetical protein